MLEVLKKQLDHFNKVREEERQFKIGKCKCDKDWNWDNVSLVNGNLVFSCPDCKTGIEVVY